MGGPSLQVVLSRGLPPLFATPLCVWFYNIFNTLWKMLLTVNKKGRLPLPAREAHAGGTP
jgi:hypothetical protein